MQVSLQTGRLKRTAALPAAATRVQALLAFQVKMTPQGHGTYVAWQEGSHDDLVQFMATHVASRLHALGEMVENLNISNIGTHRPFG